MSTLSNTMNLPSTVKSYATAAYNALPAISKIRLSTPQEILRKVQLVAIPLIMLYASSQAQGSDAMVTPCIICAACIATLNPACFWPCVICGVALPVPTGLALSSDRITDCTGNECPQSLQ